MLPSATANCSADTAMTASYATISGMSLSLGAGTWLVLAQIYSADFGVANNVFFKLKNVTDAIDYVCGLNTTFNGTGHTVQLVALITLAGTKTIEVQGVQTGAGAVFVVNEFLDTTVQATHVLAIDVSSLAATAIADCSADFSPTGSYGVVTGCSLSLGAGTWLVFAQMQIFVPVAACTTWARIYNATDAIEYDGLFMSVDSGFSVTTSMSAIFTIAGTKTVRLEAKDDGGATVMQFGDHASIQGTTLIAVQIA